MLAFSGCYYGGGEKERRELAAIRRRWRTLHVRAVLCVLVTCLPSKSYLLLILLCFNIPDT